MAGGGSLIGQGPFFGLLSGISWGAGDFSGGLLSRYASVLAGLATTQFIGWFGALALLLLSGEPQPSAESLAYAVAASGVGTVGLGLFYYALSRGTMGVVAPLAALIGAGLPVLLAIVGGEHVAPPRLAGIALALVAVVVISLPGGDRTAAEERRVRIDLGELPLVVLAGLGFAGFFILIDRATAHGETFWPMAVGRSMGSLLIVGAILIALLRAQGPTLRARISQVFGVRRIRGSGLNGVALISLMLVAGLGDLGGNVFFLFAKQDVFSVAVVLSSLYPVITTILARLLLHERLRPLQVGGVCLATFSLPLLAGALG